MFFGPTSKPVPVIDEVIRKYKSNETFIGPMIFPTWGTKTKTGYLPIIPRSQTLRVIRTATGPGAKYNRVAFAASGTQYFCEKDGLECSIPDEITQANADMFDSVREAAIMVEVLVRRQTEIRLAAAVHDTTAFTAGNGLYTDVSSAPWSAAGSDVEGQIQTAIETFTDRNGVAPNALQINRKQLRQLMNNTAIKAWFKGGTLPWMHYQDALKALATNMELDHILVGDAVKDTAEEGATPAITKVWSDTYAALLRIGDEGSAMAEAQFGRSVLWTRNTPEDPVVSGRYDEATESDVVKVKHFKDELVLDANLIQLLEVN